MNVNAQVEIELSYFESAVHHVSHYTTETILRLLETLASCRLGPENGDSISCKRLSVNGEAPLQEMWEVWSIPSLQLFPGQLWPGVEAPVRVPSMD